MTETKADLLLEFLLRMLTPLLMAGGITDNALAGFAARQAIDAYRARGAAEHVTGELVTITQIIGFAVTALDDLRLSMGADLSLSMKLKLRGNANALSRSSVHNTEALAKARLITTRSQPSLAEQVALAEWEEPETTPAGSVPNPADPIPEPMPATLTTEQRDRHVWADAMTRAAADLRSRASRIAPEQRKADQLWVDVLTGVASELRQPNQPVHAGRSTAELLRITLMAGDGGFPDHLVGGAPRQAKRAGK